jgi:hypothetical protein
MMDKNSEAIFSSLSAHQVKAADALLDLCAAVNEGGLSIADFVQVIELAVAEGHDTILIDLAMVMLAVRMAAPEGITAAAE